MQVKRLTCNIGAELKGVQIKDAIESEDLFNEIYRQMLENKVIFFRDQDLTPEQHVAFARKFGDLEDHPVAGGGPRRQAAQSRIPDCIPKSGSDCP